jgi:tRNA(fMet)-specific endonuclease VapC
VGLVVDSSSLVAAERGAIDLRALLTDEGGEDVVVAAITAAELLHGVHRLNGASRARAEEFVNSLLALLPVVPFDLDIARAHGALAADLAGRGVAVGAHDLIIAATAVSLDYRVATRDLRSFPKFDGLTVVRW